MECLFCKIVKKETPAYIIAENEVILAILDAYPASDGHVLLITKKHFPNIAEIDEQSWKYLLPLMKKIINKLKNTNLPTLPQGFNIISNMNEIASQSIFHFHLHIVPKYEKNKGFIWTTKPELKYDLNQVAEKLK
ncbi:Histidine triad (HIT) protein [endosymbiont DhMRE of Dentiscutata heterogama]|uniref:HIT family protein n=1 Tax=endosymbiont DhMRE of Dentiscutata heterogama TaxID=1609546 RepID=UPI000629D4BD|nr:HIT family protein [endosymbiont DhMRE of Dentiscutata heterogama]CFW93032.1 Histidine triad (HIT) protein [endosymbiont DhMRE of Dentiscutata heterogama]